MSIYEVSVTIRKRMPGESAREITITDDAGATAGPGVLSDLLSKVATEAYHAIDDGLSSALTPEGRKLVERRQALRRTKDDRGPADERAARERQERERNGADDEARRPGSLAERLGAPIPAGRVEPNWSARSSG